jgi:hypothetical protein
MDLDTILRSPELFSGVVGFGVGFGVGWRNSRKRDFGNVDKRISDLLDQVEPTEAGIIGGLTGLVGMATHDAPFGREIISLPLSMLAAYAGIKLGSYVGTKTLRTEFTAEERSELDGYLHQVEQAILEGKLEERKSSLYEGMKGIIERLSSERVSIKLGQKIEEEFKKMMSETLLYRNLQQLCSAPQEESHGTVIPYQGKVAPKGMAILLEEGRYYTFQMTPEGVKCHSCVKPCADYHQEDLSLSLVVPEGDLLRGIVREIRDKGTEYTLVVVPYSAKDTLDQRKEIAVNAYMEAYTLQHDPLGMLNLIARKALAKIGDQVPTTLN